MQKLKMQTPNMAEENFKKLKELFPEAVTEVEVDGVIKPAIDKDVLQQLISNEVVEGPKERYQFTWPGKHEAMLLAGKPTNKTLRPVKGENPIDDACFNNTENLYIEGDNLEVLKILETKYAGKIKMIYIDPPYNTGNDFIYKDKFDTSKQEYLEDNGERDNEGNRLVKNMESNGRFHSDWLSMMYPRLIKARNLLSDDGVIFISIDDNEVENLKKICNEIFGQDNFISILSVENNPKGRKNSAFISVSSEYCVIYSKNKEKSYFIENVPKNANDMSLDENGNYVHNSGKRVLVGENSFNKYVNTSFSDKDYSVYYRKKDNSIFIKKEKYGEQDKNYIDNGFEKYFSHYKGKLVENTYTKDKFIELFHDGALFFSNGKIYEKNFNDTIRMKSLLVNRKYEAIVNGVKKDFSMELTTTGAGTYLKSLFSLNDVPFTAPKNIGFLKMLLTLFEDTSFYILDFFSGSASLADAVMQLNAEDGGHRKFIMVQLPEPCDEKSEVYKAGYKNICEIGKERIRRAGKKILEEYSNASTREDALKPLLEEGNKRGGDRIRSLFSSVEQTSSQEKNELDNTLSLNKVSSGSVTLSACKQATSPQGEALGESTLDVGFRVLRLDSSNMKDVFYRPRDLKKDDLLSYTSNIKEDRTDLDLLFQAMPEIAGADYDAKIDEITISNKKVFKVNNNYIVACFEESINEEVIREIAKMKPYHAIFRDSGFPNDSLFANLEQIFRIESPDTEITVL